LFPVAKAALLLPESTYSLKVVENYVGFQRSLDEVNGQWSMATYIKAVKTKDPDLRKKSMNLLLGYSGEDLQATRGLSMAGEPRTVQDLTLLR
jgi:predicted RecB family nuclease